MICHPVSDLSFTSKLVEHVVVMQLLELIYVQDLHNSYQSVCKTGHLTETAFMFIKQDKVHLTCQQVNLLPRYYLTSTAFDMNDQSFLLSHLQT